MHGSIPSRISRETRNPFKLNEKFGRTMYIVHLQHSPHSGMTLSFKQHIVSTLTLSAITVNLLFWIPALVVIALIRLVLPFRFVRKPCDIIVEFAYVAAVWFDSFLLKSVLGLKVNLIGERPLNRKATYLVVSNHRSWFDILILQMLITGQGPIVKFLIKKELIFVPVVGWICLALNFPRLGRRKQSMQAPDSQKDYEAVASAALDLGERPCALLNFAEGTRFTPAKHERQNNGLKHMLKPKLGGLNIMLDNMPDCEVLDVTLVYPDRSLSFWQGLSGKLKSIDVHLNYYKPSDITDLPAWINTRWQEKDALLDEAFKRQANA